MFTFSLLWGRYGESHRAISRPAVIHVAGLFEKLL